MISVSEVFDVERTWNVIIPRIDFKMIIYRLSPSYDKSTVLRYDLRVALEVPV